MKLYHQINNLQNLKDDEIDKIAFILATCKDIEDRKIEIKATLPHLEDEIILQISEKCNTSKFGHLSIKAVKKITPPLQEGKTYDKACQEAGYDFKAKELDDENITNPVVKRVLGKYKKLFNAIQQQYGKPDVIKIETARELGKSKEERKSIEKQQKENQKKNQEANDFFGGNANGKQIVKHKLGRSKPIYAFILVEKFQKMT